MLAQALTLILFGASALYSQAFEAASVKPSQSPNFLGMRGGPGTNDPGQITWRSVTLRDVLMRAYGMQDYQIIGPGWLPNGRYEIVAKLPPGASKEQFQIMLQNLLTERFQMQAHRETREVNVYELVVAKGGPKFQASPPAAPATGPATDPTEPDGTKRLAVARDGIIELLPSMQGKGHLQIRTFRGNELRARRESLAYLLEQVVADVRRPVIDKTGLTGEFDYAMKFSPQSSLLTASNAGNPADPAAAPVNDRAPDIFIALQEQLGLRLESKKAPGELLIVDRIEKAPTEN